MLTAYLFLLLCFFLTLLLSPVVIRYTKDTRAYFVVHFVFFSLTLYHKGVPKKNGTQNSKATKNRTLDAIRRTLRYALPRTTVCVQSLPIPDELAHFLSGPGLGLYYFLLSFPLSLFRRCTSDPLLCVRDEEIKTVDLRFRMRLYTFLHTFLIYLAQYRKKKEARKSHVRNENE